MVVSTSLFAAPSSKNWSCNFNQNAKTWDCLENDSKEDTPNDFSPTKYYGSFLAVIDNDWEFDPSKDNLCHGYYLPPALEAWQEAPSEFVTLEADESTINRTGDSSLSGNVGINYKHKFIHADSAQIFRDKATGNVTKIEANGKVTELEPNLRLKSSSLNYFLADDKLELGKGDYRLYERHGRGFLQKATLSGNNLKLTGATFTTCAPDKNTWHIKAQEISLNKTSGRGQAFHTTLWVKKVPILYTPYFNFPVDKRRKTGFLFPDISSSDSFGLAIGLPLYINLAPNYDWLLTPRIISKRGIHFNNRFRYLTNGATGVVNFDFLPSDNEYRKFRRDKRENHPGILDSDPKITNLESGTTRAYLNMTHYANWNDNWYANIDYNYVWDDNYFVDLAENLSDAATTQLLQKIDVSYYHKYFKSNFILQNYQVLHPFNGPLGVEPYRILPKFSLNFISPSPWHGFDYNVYTEFTNFKHKRDPRTLMRFTTGTRVNVRPALSYMFYRPYFYFNPEIAFDYTVYNLSRSIADLNLNKQTSITRSVPLYTVDSGFIFERKLNFHSLPYTQTLEPRIYYLYVPYRGQQDIPNFDSNLFSFSYYQLFRNNRMSGVDRIADANQLSLSVSSRIFDNFAQEKMKLGVGNIIYFNDRVVTVCDKFANPNCIINEQPKFKDNFSALVGFFDYYISENYNFSANIEYDHENSNTDKLGFLWQYTDNYKKVINLEYQHLRVDPAQSLLNPSAQKSLQQVLFSFAMPINYRYRLVGNLNYDLENHRTITSIFGIEYDSCCTKLRLVGRRFLEPSSGGEIGPESNNYNSGVYLQFVFKGLASIGNSRVERSLKEWINNYNPNDKF